MRCQYPGCKQLAKHTFDGGFWCEMHGIEKSQEIKRKREKPKGSG